MRGFRTIRNVVLALMISVVPAASFAGVFINISIAPPPLPVYAQPPCPQPGYIWTPGYWAYGPMGYYWVPGVWVMAPTPGLLWTPGYWGHSGGYYAWHNGYWGSQVGFYGGVNYGYGYPGTGFYGGRWVGNQYSYNTAVVNVNRTVIRNTYVDRNVYRGSNNRVSYNGPGGSNARATQQQTRAYQQRRYEVTPTQTQHREQASQNRGNFASQNRGWPATPAMARPEREIQPQARGYQNRPQNRQVQARPERPRAQQQRENQRNHAPARNTNDHRDQRGR